MSSTPQNTPNPTRAGTLHRPPRALTIAGSDSGGGAGIQADLKTFSALGCYGLSAVTALTAQNTRAVDGVFGAPPEFVAQQIRTVLRDIGADSIKIGMLGTAPVIEAVADALREFPGIPVILDPVMVAKSGDRLLEERAAEAMIRELFPLAEVVTPNIPELEALSGVAVADSAGAEPDAAHALQAASNAAAKLLALGAGAVLVKGGHLDGELAVDALYRRTGVSPDLTLANPRIATANTHGTGCTYSSAIAAGLAKGLPLPDAVREANAYLHRAIEQASRWQVGGGHGPVHHFHPFFPIPRAPD